MGLAPGPRGRQGALWSRPSALPAGGAAAAQGGAAPAPPISPVAGREAAPETETLALVNPASEGEPWRRRGRHLRTRPALRLCSRGHLAAALGARHPPFSRVGRWRNRARGRGGRSRSGDKGGGGVREPGARALRPEGAGSRAEPGRARGGHDVPARRGAEGPGGARPAASQLPGAGSRPRALLGVWRGGWRPCPRPARPFPAGAGDRGCAGPSAVQGERASCARWLSTPRGTAGTLDRARGLWGRRYKGSRGHEVSERPGSGEQTQGSEWSGQDAGAGSSARGAGAGLSPPEEPGARTPAAPPALGERGFAPHAPLTPAPPPGRPRLHLPRVPPPLPPALQRGPVGAVLLPVRRRHADLLRPQGPVRRGRRPQRASHPRVAGGEAQLCALLLSSASAWLPPAAAPTTQPPGALGRGVRPPLLPTFPLPFLLLRGNEG